MSRPKSSVGSAGWVGAGFCRGGFADGTTPALGVTATDAETAAVAETTGAAEAETANATGAAESANATGVAETGTDTDTDGTTTLAGGGGSGFVAVWPPCETKKPTPPAMPSNATTGNA